MDNHVGRLQQRVQSTAIARRLWKQPERMRMRDEQQQKSSRNSGQRHYRDGDFSGIDRKTAQQARNMPQAEPRFERFASG